VPVAKQLGMLTQFGRHLREEWTAIARRERPGGPMDGVELLIS
jgi:hypothetical protein